ncbi:MAG: hypothetical protein V3V62_06680 [bacterium]
MAKKGKKRASKNAFSPEDLERARATAAGLEASFTEPAPPGALAPAPLFDEIRELGEAGVAGMLAHLTGPAPRDRAAALASIRALGDPAILPGLLEQAKEARWPVRELTALCETIRALDPKAALPASLDGDSLMRAHTVAERLAAGEALSAEAAGEVSDQLLALPPRLQEIALRTSIGSGGKNADGPGGGANLLALAGALAGRGASPPAVLIDAIAALATLEAANALSSLAASAKDKGASSRLRKALFRLRRSGVEADAPKEAGGQAPPAAAPPENTRAFVSAVDGQGQMLIWLTRSRQPRGRFLFQARLRRGGGIEDFVAAEMSAKEVRDIIVRFDGQLGFPVTEVPAGYAIWLLQRAQREHESSGTPVPPGFTRSNFLLAPLADADAFPEGAHPVRRLLPPRPEGAARLEPREMFSNGAFWSWVIEGETLQSHFRAFLESMESKVVLSEEQKKERLDQIVDKAAAELFAEEALRLRLAGQLEDNAFFFHRKGEEEMAWECIALAGEMEAGGAPTAFFTEMVKFSISMIMNRIVMQHQHHEHEHEHGHEHHPHEGAAEPGEAAAGSEDPPVIVAP